MTITELIAELQYALETRGDITVALADWSENYATPIVCGSNYYDARKDMLVLNG